MHSLDAFADLELYLYLVKGTTGLELEDAKLGELALHVVKLLPLVIPLQPLNRPEDDAIVLGHPGKKVLLGLKLFTH